MRFVPPAGDRWEVVTDVESIAAGYNQLLERCVGPVVLVHDDVTLGPDTRWKIIDHLADGASIVGQAGAHGPAGIDWWAGVTFGQVQTPTRMLRLGPPEQVGVDVVDGFLLGLGPEVVDGWRFDEAYEGFHGYDADLCAYAQTVGWRVDVADAGATHHTNGGYGDRDAWDAAQARWRSKWQPTTTNRTSRLTQVS